MVFIFFLLFIASHNLPLHQLPTDDGELTMCQSLVHVKLYVKYTGSF